MLIYLYEYSIKDCFRLGKFKSDALCPRPILIRFLRSTEACAVLAKIASFQAPVQIRPDLTSESGNGSFEGKMEFDAIGIRQK